MDIDVQAMMRVEGEQRMGRWQVRRGSDLGAALAELRVARGLTQVQMAAGLGLSAAYLAKIEQGRTTPLLDAVIDALRSAGADLTVTWPDQQHEPPPNSGHDDSEPTDGPLRGVP